MGETKSVAVERDGARLVIPFAFTRPVTIASVSDGAAREAGLERGDTILSIDGAPVRVFEDLRMAVMNSDGKALVFEVERAGESLSFDVTPRPHTRTDENGDAVQQWLIGVTGDTAIGLRSALERSGSDRGAWIRYDGHGRYHHRVPQLHRRHLPGPG